MSSKTWVFLGLHSIFTDWFIYNESWLHLTYDSTVSALQCGAGARDGSTGAGAAEDGAAGCAVECWTWAVGARRRRAAGQSGARTDALASSRALEREKKRKKVGEQLHFDDELWSQLNVQR